MARRARRRRGGARRGGGVRGLRLGRGGFINSQMLGAVAGGAGTILLANSALLKKLPKSWINTPMKVGAVHAGIGLAGWLAVRKFSAPAAYAILGVQIARAITAARAAKGLAGYGEPDGVDYLMGMDDDIAGYLGDGEDELVGDEEEMMGLGMYDQDALEV